MVPTFLKEIFPFSGSMIIQGCETFKMSAVCCTLISDLKRLWTWTVNNKKEKVLSRQQSNRHDLFLLVVHQPVYLFDVIVRHGLYQLFGLPDFVFGEAFFQQLFE